MTQSSTLRGYDQTVEYRQTEIETCSLLQFQLGPINIRPDGTRVFANPFSVDPIPLIALSDVGFWVRYYFDHQLKSSGQKFRIARTGRVEKK